MEMEIGQIITKEIIFSFDAGHLRGEEHRQTFGLIFEIVLKFTKELIRSYNPVELKSKHSISSQLLSLSAKNNNEYRYEISQDKFWNSLSDIAYHLYESDNDEIRIVLRSKFTLIIEVVMDPIYIAIRRK